MRHGDARHIQRPSVPSKIRATTRRSGEAKQYHAVGFVLRRKGECSEILVFSNQEAFFAQRQGYQFFVHGALLKLAYGEHIVTGRTQGPHRREVAALVRQKSQGKSYSLPRLSTASCETASAA